MNILFVVTNKILYVYNVTKKERKMEDVILKLTGTLFKDEKGFRYKVQKFEISDENDSKIVVKDENFTILNKEKGNDGISIGFAKFHFTTEPFAVEEGVLYMRAVDEWDACMYLKREFINRIESQINEKKELVNIINESR